MPTAPLQDRAVNGALRFLKRQVSDALLALRPHAGRHKRDFVWRGTIDVATIRIWLRHPVS